MKFCVLREKFLHIQQEGLRVKSRNSVSTVNWHIVDKWDKDHFVLFRNSKVPFDGEEVTVLCIQPTSTEEEYEVPTGVTFNVRGRITNRVTTCTLG